MQGYVNIKRFDHYGEKAVPTGRKRGKESEKEAEFIILVCQHGTHTVWLRREDIT